MPRQEAGFPPSADVSHVSPGASVCYVTAAVLIYVGLLCILDMSWPAETGASIWELQDSARLSHWLIALLGTGLRQFFRYLPVGLLLWLGIRWGRGGWPDSRRAVRLLMEGIEALAAWAMTCALAALVLGAAVGGIPPAVLLVLPSLGGALGILLGWVWQQSRRSHLWLVRQMMLLVVAGILGLAGLMLLALEGEPLDYEPPEVTSDHRRHLVGVFQASESPGSPRRDLQLTDDEVNLLLAWGLMLGSPDRKARITFGEDRSSVEASLGLPLAGRRAYLNMRGSGSVDWEERGRLRVRWDGLQIGRLAIPAWFLNRLTPLVVGLLHHDPDMGQVLEVIEDFQIGAGRARLVIRSSELTRRAIPSLLVRMGQHPEVRASTAAHFAHLASGEESRPPGDAGFEATIRRAFRFAQQRSEKSSAVEENRAAIYALAIMLGHPRIEQFVGPVTSASSWAAARRAPGRVTLRGRADWTQHFWVSAALAVLSSEAASDAVGLLKEELDAGKGGSGFSFSDLLADRAGTLFGLAAIHEEAAARRMQQRLLEAFDVDHLFPPAADLPEGIPDAEFQRDYGGVGGPGYNRVVAEIERRLNQCDALHPHRR